MIAAWIAAAFLSGSCMFSFWLGVAAKKNLSTVGDGNPGAINLWRSAGMKFGLAGIALDFLKGYAPVWLAMETGVCAGYAVVPIAIAPVAGHAFSPFLKGRGGKAIAVTFGVWSALTDFGAALAYAVILALLWAIAGIIRKGRRTSAEADGFQVVFGMALVVVYLLARGVAGAILLFWLCNMLLLIFTHRRELAGWIGRKFRGAAGSDDHFST